MPEKTPNVIILHGDDEIAMQKFITEQINLLGDSAMAEMNVSRLDGKANSIDELTNTVMAAPFFTDRRLIFLTNPLHGMESKRGGDDSGETPETGKAKETRQKFLLMLDSMPDSSTLVLIIEDHQKWKAGAYHWETLTERHFLMKWAVGNKDRCVLHAASLPADREMPSWIQKKVREMGGKISLPGAVELSQYVGTDTRLAVLELEKLSTYAGNREIDADDVMALSTSSVSGKIWDLTDAIGERNARNALRIFHQLMDTLDLRQEIYPMVIWQFRQLLLGCEVVSRGGGISELMQSLKIAEFQAKKLYPQVQRFSLARLKQAYRKLMEIEEESKGAAGRSGGGDLSVLIDELIVELAE
jgi:DNA polymerase-3 subunit delta